MLIALIQQRGDLGLLTLTAFLQSVMWGGLTVIYWIRREQGKLDRWWMGEIDIWLCSILAVAWILGLILFFLGQCKRGFGGGPSCRMLIYENALMVLGASLFFLAAALAVTGRLVWLFASSVDNPHGLYAFNMGSLLAYISLLLLCVCLLVGRAAVA